MANPPRVVVFDDTTRKFTTNLIDPPVPGRGEIVVKVDCCTICGSDLHTATGRRTGPSPSVLGHEIIGTIVDIDDAIPPQDYWGQSLRVGQRVTWGLVVSCGQCANCQIGLVQKCASLFKYGHEKFDGQRSTGGLADYCTLVANTTVFPLPDELPNEVTCPANCATATVAAAIRTLSETNQIAARTILITGMGMLGLTACAMIAEQGAANIICADTDQQRLNLATAFGATHLVSATDPAELTAALDSCSNKGVDAAFDFSGVNSAVHTCLNSLRVGGTAILAGSVFPTDLLGFSPEQIVRRMLTIRGIHNYIPADLANALEFLRNHSTKYPFSKLVEHTFCLDDTEQAFRYATDHSPVRVAVIP